MVTPRHAVSDCASLNATVSCSKQVKTFFQQSRASPVPSGRKPKGMQLGAPSGLLPGGPVEAVRWGGDPMYVIADADDYHHSLSQKF
jgi:hypothetical protein